MENVSKNEMEELLAAQSKIILGAVDLKLQIMEERIDQKFAVMEKRMDQKFAKETTTQQLLTTLDKFLERLTNREQEFSLLKA